MSSDNPRGRLAGALAIAALLCASFVEQEASPAPTTGEARPLPAPDLT